jgi:hypothetical protein
LHLKLYENTADDISIAIIVHNREGTAFTERKAIPVTGCGGP